MAVLQLRNYIPISAPARREAGDGAEPDLRVSLHLRKKHHFVEILPLGIHHIESLLDFVER
jgi:hypothetical protein